MPGSMKHKLESRLPGERSITSDTQMTPPLWQKVKKKTKEPLDDGVGELSGNANMKFFIFLQSNLCL